MLTARKYVAAVKHGYWANHERACTTRAAYQRANLEKHRVADAKWRKDNLEKKRAKDAIYAKSDKERARKSAWNKANLDYFAAWRKDHQEVVRAHQVRYRKTHPEKRKFESHLRRARQRAIPSDFTAEQWVAICLAQKGYCACCHDVKKLTIDHIIPLAKGGHNTATNIQGLCHKCNSKKHTKIIDYRPSLAAFLAKLK